MEQPALLKVLFRHSENNRLKLKNKTKTSAVSQSYRFPQANVHFRPVGTVLEMLSEI